MQAKLFHKMLAAKMEQDENENNQYAAGPPQWEKEALGIQV